MCVHVCVRVCIRFCIQSCEGVLPGPVTVTPLSSARQLGRAHTWSVWYSEASDRLSEKLRKFSWASEHTIS